MRQERAGGDLAVKLRAPATGYGARAFGALAIGGIPVVLDLVAVALDESGCALRTARVLELTDPARQVPGIDEAKSGALADIHCAQQVGGLGIGGIGHLLILLGRSDMPGEGEPNARPKLFY